MTPPIPSPTFAATLPAGETVTVRLRPMAVSVTVDGTTVYTFDLEGRLYGAFVDGRNYRRGLDNGVLVKSRTSGTSVSTKLDAAGAARFLAEVHDCIHKIAACASDSEDGAEVRCALDRIVVWNPEELSADGDRFKEVYLPISILPPDQYMALVVQVTEGCPWNRCTFCDLYRDRHFRIKGGEELKRHIGEVKDLLGEGLRLRRSIFLGDANALTMPWERLEETFGILREAFCPGDDDGPTCDNVHAFTDAFAPGLRTPAEIRQLSDWGLRRVTVGLETGHDPLLEMVEKQGRSEDAVEAVKHLKANGVAVNVVVMAGLGGERYAEAHVDDTLRAIGEMNLGAKDIVYLSPLVAHPQLPYARTANRNHVVPLSRDAVAGQMDEMKWRVRKSSSDSAVALYDIRRFIY